MVRCASIHARSENGRLGMSFKGRGGAFISTGVGTTCSTRAELSIARPCRVTTAGGIAQVPVSQLVMRYVMRTVPRLSEPSAAVMATTSMWLVSVSVATGQPTSASETPPGRRRASE